MKAESTDKPEVTSSVQIGIAEKARELAGLLRMQMKGLFRPGSSAGILAIADEYAELLNHYGVGSMNGLRALEIGYGARPLLHFALTSMGVDLLGVDLDMPLIHFSPGRIWSIYSRNGAERAVKTSIRYFLKDLSERRELKRDLKTRGYQMSIRPDKLLVEDAAQLQIPAQSLEFVISEDVFEHIPRESLQTILNRMAEWLKPDGIALIRPHIFTGISGSHLTEWFGHSVIDVSRKRVSEPWEHLRKKRFKANTWLNELSRNDYRKMMNARFEILEERDKQPMLGACYLTEGVRKELSAWSDEDLFSNKVLFVLRPKKQSAARQPS